MCGTYKEKLISTISFYVVLIPYGIGDVVLISLTFLSGKTFPSWYCWFILDVSYGRVAVSKSGDSFS